MNFLLPKISIRQNKKEENNIPYSFPPSKLIQLYEKITSLNTLYENKQEVLTLLCSCSLEERYFIFARLSWIPFLYLVQDSPYLHYYCTKKTVKEVIERTEEKYWKVGLSSLSEIKLNLEKEQIIDLTFCYSSNQTFHPQTLKKRLFSFLQKKEPLLFSFLQKEQEPFSFLLGPTITNCLSKNTPFSILDLYLSSPSPLDSLLSYFPGPIQESNTYYKILFPSSSSFTLIIHKHIYSSSFHTLIGNELDLLWDLKEDKIYASPFYHLYQKVKTNEQLILSQEQEISSFSSSSSKFIYFPLLKPKQNLKRCYNCKEYFQFRKQDLILHYKELCISCALFYYQNRIWFISSLKGTNAIVTGGRIKIGYTTALQLLRSGVNVIITTRFPCNALYRYQQEPDYAEFKPLLTIYSLDLRNTPELIKFIEWFKSTHSALHILINNAAQTFTYDQEYYEEMYKYENSQESLFLLSPSSSSSSSLIPLEEKNKKIQVLKGEENKCTKWNFKTDQYQELITTNGGGKFWNQTTDSITVEEILQINLVNQIAPQILISQLKPFMKSTTKRTYIINVVCQEGRFSMKEKPSTHFHTNCAKAALNMITRTIYPECRKQNTFIHSVDPGWISFALDTNRICPLDCLDAAQQILYPIYKSEQLLHDEQVTTGHLWKSYKIMKEW